MKKRLIYGSALVALAVLVTLVIWQGSFTFGAYGPASPEQTFILWAVSTLVVLLTVTLGFMLLRTVVKLYIERQRNRVGSRIKTKLVVGALALSFTPVFFLVLWSVYILNRNLDKWFTRPAENIKLNLVQAGQSFEREALEKARAQARWLAGVPEIRDGSLARDRIERLCGEGQVHYAAIRKPDGTVTPLCGRAEPDAKPIAAEAPLGNIGAVVVRARLSADLAAKQREIEADIARYDQLAVNRREIRRFYLLLMLLITLFVLFAATWIAQFMARQISEPIAALVEAADEVRGGNLGRRVTAPAIDELATLVHGFNEMTQALEVNSRELERRRRFTEAILESIPTGVLSLSSDGRIQSTNPALARIFPQGLVARAKRIDDLFSKDDAAEIRYLMKRARRLGQPVSRQFELKRDGQTLHLSATASALEEKVTSGFVLVLEDASELLRAQKAVAWHEVARRIAHEMKNPLTPIALCAERLSRQLDRTPPAGDSARILRECSSTILREVESVKTLVDEFTEFARFPAARPVPSDLNDVVENALAIFEGRLDGVHVEKSLTPNLPPVNLDREQFKRVLINLVDNAAEAMQDAPVRRLWVATHSPARETVELIVADTGSGVSQEDKEKLFLPYFSTKGRGTGLGLAIVSHILAEHNAQIRVEDNLPTGARFIVEIPALAAAESEARA